MRLYRRGKTWWCWVYQDGRRVCLSTRCHDRKAAEAVARDYERRAADPVHAAAQETTLDSALSAYRREVSTQSASAGTAHYYLKKHGQLVRGLGPQTPLARITAQDVARYRGLRRSEGVAEATISKEVGALRTVLRWARHQGLWQGEPAAVTGRDGLEPSANGLRVHRPSAKRSQKTGSR